MYSSVIKLSDDEILNLMKDRVLQLADFPLEDAETSIVLIGADFYWEVVSGKIERLTYFFVALDSTFGWAIQRIVSNSSETETSIRQSDLKAVTDILGNLISLCRP